MANLTPHTDYIDLLINAKLDDVYDTFRAIPYEERTLRVSWIAIGRDARCFELVPQDVMTRDFIQHAVKLQPDNIGCVHKDQIDDDLCIIALTGDIESLTYIPEEKRSSLVWQCIIDMLQFSNSPDVWEKVLRQAPTPELILQGLSEMPDSEKKIAAIIRQLVPGQLNDTLVDWALDKDANCYLHIPEKYQTPERAFEAVSKKGTLLSQLSDEYRNDIGICKAAVSNYKYAFNSVPSSLRTVPFLEWTLKTHPDLLAWVLKEVDAIEGSDLQKSKRKLCEIAVESGKMEVGQSLPYKDLWLKLLSKQENNGRRDLHVGINPSIMDNHLAKELLKRSPEAYQFLPQKIKHDPEIAELAVNLNSRNLNVVPDAIKTEHMFLKAVKDYHKVVLKLPERLKTKELCSQLVDINGACLSLIPQEFVDRELCERVMNKPYKSDTELHLLLLGVPYPDLIAQGIRKIHNPGSISELVRSLPPALVDERVWLEIIKKIPAAITTIPDSLHHKDFYNSAFSYEPYSFSYIPEQLKSPEMYLEVKKQLPHVDIQVPPSIENGKNIYTFGQLLEKHTGQKYTVQEIKEIYGGKPFLLANFIAMDNGHIPRQMIRFDKINFSFASVEENKQKIEKGIKI